MCNWKVVLVKDFEFDHSNRRYICLRKCIWMSLKYTDLRKFCSLFWNFFSFYPYHHNCTSQPIKVKYMYWVHIQPKTHNVHVVIVGFSHVTETKWHYHPSFGGFIHPQTSGKHHTLKKAYNSVAAHVSAYVTSLSHPLTCTRRVRNWFQLRHKERVVSELGTNTGADFAGTLCNSQSKPFSLAE